MPLIICTECQHEVPDKAIACPNCGCPVSAMELDKSNTDSKIESTKTPNTKTNNKTKITIIALSAGFVIFASLFLITLLNKKEPATTGGGNSQVVGNAENSAYKKELVRIEGGNFYMGSYDDGDAERPVHKVTLKSFSMGKYPVTQKEYEKVMGSNPSKFMGQNRPVDNVNWYDAVEYCNKLSEKEGLTPAYTIDKSREDYNNINNDDYMKWAVTWNRKANGYRLPTEAEWEYAARGGNGSPGEFEYSGSNNINEVAWYKDNSGGSTHDVGSKKPNGLGLYDMSGNVDEWCWDWYGRSYYADSPASDPAGPSSGSYRVARGGTWSYSSKFARSTLRNYGLPTLLRHFDGFRVVRN